MSHFAVLVVGDDIDKQLAPFQENNCGDCPREYLSFHDTETDYLKQYNEEAIEMIRCEDGTLAYRWDDRFRKPDAGFFGMGIGSDTHEAPPHFEHVQVKHKDRYATFEAFMADYVNDKERDPETGRYGYWENEKKRWDCWRVGGRWNGFFKLKASATSGELAKPRWDSPPTEAGTADSAKKKDIDFEAMRSAYVARRLDRYRKFHAIVAGRPVPSWQEILNRHGVDNIAAARAEYHGNPVTKDLNKDRDFAFDDTEEYEVAEKYFVRRAANQAICTHAVLKDGEWYEKGLMGWWGVVHDEKEPGKWEEEFAAMLDGLPDDTLLTIVDCHI